ncbi:hypothetical protein [Elizabethkingia meningoseptica]|uniref:hypothetical protein n=1 Tax=Elizabethkingia meningoseptica TaxID=238 RepID=UPI0023AF6656|nr:hypothetical protein [Elizabethkingia meningoseptica]MDE5493290.1 hypothetical protein [Elizabethkingia meningoseptica]
MKIIIILCSIILVIVLWNYPVFDSKGISYSIVFSCFVIITFSAAKLYNPSDNESYKSVEKEMNHLHQLDGIFRYTTEGFYIKQKNETEFIKWSEIVSVYSFSIPFGRHTNQTGLEMITDKKSYEFNDRQTQGIVKLRDKLYDHLPTWELNAPTIRVNNSGLEKTKLYERESSLQ